MHFCFISRNVFMILLASCPGCRSSHCIKWIYCKCSCRIYFIIYCVRIICEHREFENECVITYDVIFEHIKIPMFCITICRVQQHYYIINIIYIYILIIVLYNTYKYTVGKEVTVCWNVSDWRIVWLLKVMALIVCGSFPCLCAVWTGTFVQMTEHLLPHFITHFSDSDFGNLNKFCYSIKILCREGFWNKMLCHWVSSCQYLRGWQCL